MLSTNFVSTGEAMSAQYDIDGIRFREKMKALGVRRSILFLTLIGVCCYIAYSLFIGSNSKNVGMDKRAVPAGESDVADYRALGERLFHEHCAVCHGTDGRGLIGPDLTRKDFTYGKTEAALIKTISTGRPGGMPAFGNILSQEQIKWLSQFIRSL